MYVRTYIESERESARERAREKEYTLRSSSLSSDSLMPFGLLTMSTCWRAGTRKPFSLFHSSSTYTHAHQHVTRVPLSFWH